MEVAICEFNDVAPGGWVNIEIGETTSTALKVLSPRGQHLDAVIAFRGSDSTPYLVERRAGQFGIVAHLFTLKPVPSALPEHMAFRGSAIIGDLLLGKDSTVILTATADDYLLFDLVTGAYSMTPKAYIICKQWQLEDTAAKEGERVFREFHAPASAAI